MQIDATAVDGDYDEWANADLYRLGDEYPVPDDLTTSEATYEYFMLAEPKGESDVVEPYVVYPVTEDGSLYDDVTWEPLSEFEVGKQTSIEGLLEE